MYLLATSLAAAAPRYGASRRAGVGRVRPVAILSILFGSFASYEPSTFNLLECSLQLNSKPAPPQDIGIFPLLPQGGKTIY
ncbi:MAG: hypothetical protein A4E20_02385 [Nitrospira sp. SG-bin2]|nr:MAG: hypothetical protein A4E20_02385 [Nitrospira sp. SG-bin2]